MTAGLTREAAREAAREELSRSEYAAAQPPLLQRLLERVLEELDRLLASLSGLPGGGAGVVLLVLLLGGLVALVLTRLGPLARDRRAVAPLDTGPRRTAAQHRADAEAAAAQGRFAEAVRERLRAVVRDLEARGVLDPRPGRTAGEVARDAGARVPGIAADLARGATAFDEVWYGGRPADADTYALLVEVDRAVTGGVRA